MPKRRSETISTAANTGSGTIGVTGLGMSPEIKALLINIIMLVGKIILIWYKSVVYSV